MHSTLLATVVALSLAGGAAAQTIQPNYGESVNGKFPNWQERTMHELTNRARVAPATELAGCPPSSCSEAACYSPAVPLLWSYDLNRAARFHSLSEKRFPFDDFATPCSLFPDIGLRYPGTSDGSRETSCTPPITSGTTSQQDRVTLFGAIGGAAEFRAFGFSPPYTLFYVWLYQFTLDPSCSFRFDNRFRFALLSDSFGPAVGVGYEPGEQDSQWPNYWTLELGGSGTVPKIPSGSHWTSIGQSRDPVGIDNQVEFWANWYDPAGGPTKATVVLDGVPLTMLHPIDRGSLTNGAWTTSVSSAVSSTCHSYYFSFASATGTPVRYPDSGAFGFGAEACADWRAAPAITSVSPMGGNVAGGTSVTIRGTDFDPAATVLFDTTTATASVMDSTTITATTPAHPAGAVNVTVRNPDAQSGVLLSAFAYVLPAPSNLSATATGTTQVTVTWNAVANATSCQVYRRDSGSDFALLPSGGVMTGPGTWSYTETVSAGAAYLYKVRAVDSDSNISDYSNRDLASTFTFTDDPLLAGSTRIQAIHLTELQGDVNMIRSLAGIGTFSFTHTSLSGEPILPLDTIQLRNALDDALSNLSISGLPVTSIAPGSPITRQELTDIRNAFK